LLACVTGGTGFIGSHIVRVLLADGHTVRVLHRANSKMSALDGLKFESRIGDVTDVESMRQAFAGCDWVFHVAAVADYWHANPDWMFTVNVEGTRNVLQAARDAQIKRVIFTSSGAAIGIPSDKETPSDESIPFNLKPQEFSYGYSKWQAEQIALEAVEQGQDIVILNPSVVMGPGDLNLISGTFVMQMVQSQWLTPISHGGFGVIDVRDVAAAHLAAAKKGRSGERYILNTQNYDDAEWFALIADVIGVAKPVFTMPDFILPVVARAIPVLRRIGIQTPIDATQVRLGNRYIYFDGGKAQRELHQPQIDMRQSIQDTYDWYVANGYIKTTWYTRLLRRIGIWLR
jgi:dihydroflavonol-4-reductase